MNYKEKYEQALERASKLRVQNPFDTVGQMVEHIFPEIQEPEIQETEDEKIRKALKQGFFEYGNSFTTFGGIQVGDILTWLEKQGKQQGKSALEAWKDMRLEVYQQASGNRHEPNYSDDTTKMFSLNDIDEIIEKINEQKLANKVESKFKVGDFIVNDYCSGKVIEITNDAYLLDTGQGILLSCEHNAHLWSINDAKDGDVLANDHHILILKELGYDWSCNGTPNSVKAYCGIKPNGNFELDKDNWSFCGTLHIHPATKEQRDFLFQKMKKAGYEWDSKKKELKKVEVASKETEDERIRKAIKKALQVRCGGSRIISDEPVTLEEALTWLEEQKATDEEIIFRPIVGTDIRIAAKQALEKIDIGKKVVLAFNGAYIPVNGKTVGEIDSEYDAWLKKQGEEKSTNEVEPKFKVGDWFVNNNRKDVFLIKSITNGYCTLEDIKGNIISPCLPPCESDSHIWTIEDAKDGDVLVCNINKAEIGGDIEKLPNMTPTIFIYQNVVKDSDYIHSYCSLYNRSSLRLQNTMYYNAFVCNIHPATKEEHDLIFQKMKEADYKWDNEKKELKRIEPKIFDTDIVNVELLIKVLRKHLYTCVNKTNTYVRSKEDHITLSALIDKIIADLNMEKQSETCNTNNILSLALGNNQVQDILEDMGMLDDNGRCPHTAEEIFKAGVEYAFNLNREATSSVKLDSNKISNNIK